MALETRYSPGSGYTGLPQNLQPMDRSLIWSGVRLEQVLRHSVVFMDASATSWGATYDGHAVSGIWMAYQLPRVAVACSLSKATLGTYALAHNWPQGLRKYAFPPVSLLAQTLSKIREDKDRVLLVAPYRPNRTWFPELMLLATAPL